MKPKFTRKDLEGAQWVAERFPTASAREVADRAIDALPNDCSVADHLDVWVRAYLKAGGKTELGQ